MDFDDIVKTVQEHAADLEDLNHTVLFDLEDAGQILIDATGDTVVVTPNPDDDEAETTLVLSPENLQKSTLLVEFPSKGIYISSLALITLLDLMIEA